MKISEQWLREWVDPALTTAELAHQMTMAGLEVEAVEPVAGGFSGVVVAAILRAEPHPDADKLRVCEVDDGSGSVTIVCGAPNARPGLKAPLATVGGVLPGGLEIKRAKLRGVESQGMLCAEQELGLSDAAEGLMELAADAPVGADLRDYLGLDDTVLDIGLTPNRADCLGLRGIAREVGLLNGLPVRAPDSAPVPAQGDARFPVALADPEGCPRYVGRVIRGVDITRPSPLWLRERLRRSGLRSIDAVVDVTNYVLLELGQPLHAFDLDRLAGGIVVRRAQAGESLALLDGQTVELDAQTLVIADGSGPVAMAGIMGGAPTAVGEGTTNVFLEAAFFNPERLAGCARAFGLHTDSSHRFERGVDFNGQVDAVERATRLLLDIVGGEAGPIIEVCSPEHLPPRPDVYLRQARIERMLGVALERDEVERIFRGLGLEAKADPAGWTCAVPSWRFDIALEADLLEELARVYGYNRLPATHPRAALTMTARRERELPLRELRRHLASRGYREAITYSFIEPALQALFDPDVEPVRLTNPMSADLSVMRTSLLPGLLGAVQRNVNRQRPRVRLFETGLRFVPGEDGLAQVSTLALVVTGGRYTESWSAGGDEVDFFDLKGDLESLLSLNRSGAQFAFAAAGRPGLHPGQTAAVTRSGQRVGTLGALHPTVQAALALDRPVYLCEIDLAAVQQSALPAFTELSKFPGIRRDLSFVVDRGIPVGTLLEDVRGAAGGYLTDLTLFDVYTGKGIDPKRKSLSVGLTFRDQSRTLGDEDVSPAVSQVIDLLEKNYNAELRN